MCVYQTLASLMLTTAYKTLLRGKHVCPLCLAELINITLTHLFWTCNKTQLLQVGGLSRAEITQLILRAN